MTNEPARTPALASLKFVQLGRTFHELSSYARESDEIDLADAFQVGRALQWSDLSKEHRVIILSEAGSGKTEEIRAAAKALRAEGKAAFFLRLEDIPDDFEMAFGEAGTFEEFQQWLGGNDEGWLLLDSVDEARLRHPKDFEKAVRKIGKIIESARDRTHIVITGRTTAWRPKTDLTLCQTHLGSTPVVTTEAPAPVEDEEFDFEDATKTETRNDAGSALGFKIVTLDDLKRDQARIFVEACGVTNASEFLDAVERADAWSFTTRPQDLSELADFWLKEGKIGGRLEVLQNSVERRLIERDQARAEAKPLAVDRVRMAVKLLSGAATLTKDQTIRVPDGADNSKGTPVQEILPDWKEDEQSVLLSRPIFDEAIYGTVRFHHRSVREYLTAAWFAELLTRQSSRRAIEDLFFKSQYGIDVVVPTLRPVLPWLALLDDKIRQRVMRVAPEVLLEGGDPSQLPFDVRRKILIDVAGQILAGDTGRSYRQHTAVQRFAKPDLVGDMQQLLTTHGQSNDLAAFLFRMVWLGQLQGMRAEVLEAATSSASERYRRTTAIRAVKALGHPEDIERVRAEFAAEAGALDRSLLSEIIEGMALTAQNLAWLIACLEKTEARERYASDDLSGTLKSLVANADLALLPAFIAEVNRLLETPPVVESRFCRVSERYGWLLGAAAAAVERLIRAKDVKALEPAALGVIHKLSTSREYQSYDLDDEKSEVASLVPAWPELNLALFWHAVRHVRALESKKESGVREHWLASFGSFHRFSVDDFATAVAEIGRQTDLEDKFVALSLAFDLYRSGERTRSRRDALKKAVEGQEHLSAKLANYLRPPARPEAQKWRKQERRWKLAQVAREAKSVKNLEDSKAYLNKDLEKLVQRSRDNPSKFYQSQYYLYCRTREFEKSNSRWTEYNWQQLIPTYGAGVAKYYRDSAVAFWRHHNPKLRSEGADANSTPNIVIFGLVGLEIEAHETPDWPANLSADEVTLACKYASFELNGFPTWFPKLFEAHPQTVSAFLLNEIRHELATATDAVDPHYVLSDVSWSGQWVWKTIGPALYDELATAEPASQRSLERTLKIIQGSDVSDEDIAKLAATRALQTNDLARLGLWLGIWAGVEPAAAIDQFRSRLEGLATDEERTTLALHFATELFPDRMGDGGGVRSAFQTPQHLKDIYLLLNRHIRPEDDIERAGKGVYSPGLRDNAQGARNRVYELLTKMSGKESFVALTEIAAAFPERPWLARYPKEKAEQEADLQSWTPAQVRQFHERLERTPGNHRELAELAVMRLLDLKDDLENGDSSNAGLLLNVAEKEVRKYIGNVLRDKAQERYSIPQEEEMADAKKPDLRFHGVGFDAPVPVELKVADAGWSGVKLFERLENQLCGDYLRDTRSNRGLFVLAYQGKQQTWVLPNGDSVNFQGLVDALQRHWLEASPRFPNVDEIIVVGIDLTKRGV